VASWMQPHVGWGVHPASWPRNYVSYALLRFEITSARLRSLGFVRGPVASGYDLRQHTMSWGRANSNEGCRIFFAVP